MYKICRFLDVKILTSHNVFAIWPIWPIFMGGQQKKLRNRNKIKIIVLKMFTFFQLILSARVVNSTFYLSYIVYPLVNDQLNLK